MRRTFGRQAVREKESLCSEWNQIPHHSGEAAGVTVVWAVTDRSARKGKGMSAFAVEKGTPDSRLERRRRRWDTSASQTNELIFDNCIVPADCLLGKEGEGFKIAMMELDGGRIGIGSLAVGVGFSAIDFATQYVKEREAFGKSLSSFEAIQWMIADSYTELEAAQLLVLRAAYLKKRANPSQGEASMAKLFATETARDAGHPGRPDAGWLWLHQRLSCGAVPPGYHRNDSL